MKNMSLTIFIIGYLSVSVSLDFSGLRVHFCVCPCARCFKETNANSVVWLASCFFEHGGGVELCRRSFGYGGMFYVCSFAMRHIFIGFCGDKAGDVDAADDDDDDDGNRSLSIMPYRCKFVSFNVDRGESVQRNAEPLFKVDFVHNANIHFSSIKTTAGARPFYGISGSV